MKPLDNFAVAHAALALLVVACPAQSQPRAFALREPIPFHGAQLVGFKRGVGLKTATGVVRPDPPWCSSRSNWSSAHLSSTCAAASARSR
jgi:hypothetical protein